MYRFIAVNDDNETTAITANKTKKVLTENRGSSETLNFGKLLWKLIFRVDKPICTKPCSIDTFVHTRALYKTQ